MNTNHYLHGRYMFNITCESRLVVRDINFPVANYRLDSYDMMKW